VSLLSFDGLVRGIAEAQAERELWKRIDRRCTALAWWIRSHPMPTQDDWNRLHTDPDLEDALSGWMMLCALSDAGRALEFVTVTAWSDVTDGSA